MRSCQWSTYYSEGVSPQDSAGGCYIMTLTRGRIPLLISDIKSITSCFSGEGYGSGRGAKLFSLFIETHHWQSRPNVTAMKSRQVAGSGRLWQFIEKPNLLWYMYHLRYWTLL